MLENLEVRIAVPTLAAALAWVLAVAMMATTIVTQGWQFGLVAVCTCWVAAGLTMLRDNCKTRRVLRTLVAGRERR